MKKSKAKKTRNSGQWTEGRFNSFVRSLLRAGSLRWAPRYECIKKAFVKHGVNPKTGRKCKLHLCSRCSGLFPASKIAVDHIVPVIDPKLGFTNWHDYIERLFCESDNFQALCEPCHKRKTDSENNIATGKVSVPAVRSRIRKI